MLLGAHYALGQTLLNMGALLPARLHLEHGMAPATPQQPAPSQATPGGSRHYGVTCRSYLSRILWMLGYPDQEVQCGQEAWRMAQTLAHPFGLVDALFGSA